MNCGSGDILNATRRDVTPDLTSVQARLKISGAWWHPDHVDDILTLRMLKANGWCNEHWETRRGAWRKRADGLWNRGVNAPLDRPTTLASPTPPALRGGPDRSDRCASIPVAVVCSTPPWARPTWITRVTPQ
jgi:hypothetical protein